MRPGRFLPWLLLLAASGGLAAPGAAVRAEEGAARAGEAPPRAGIVPLDPFDPADRDAARLARFTDLAPLWAVSAPVPWGALQPERAPAGRAPAYRFEVLDEAVRVWQLAGLEPVLVLTPESPWASGAREGSDWARRLEALLEPAEATMALRSAGGTAPPTEAAWPAWERFVHDVVERYDADGEADAPGLRRAVRHVQVLDRIDPWRWLGGPADTLRLLHHAGQGALTASPGVRVVTPAFDLGGGGRDTGPAAVLARAERERQAETLARVLEMPRLFHVLAHVGAEHVADDVVNLRAVRERLAQAGAGDRAVWLLPNPTRKLGEPHAEGALPPRAEEERLRRRWLPVARNPAHGDHAPALAWLRRGQAFDLVRGFARARAAGADAVCFLSPGDRLPEGPPGRRMDEGQGLLAGAPGEAPAVGEGRTPAWWALQQVLGRVRGHAEVAEGPLGGPGRTLIFRFPPEHERPWVALLLQDARIDWAGAPGEPPVERDVAVPLPTGSYVLETCRLGPEEPARRRVEAREGVLRTTLGAAPVWVVPVR